MNTKHLKSSKLVKLLKECGLISNLSKLPLYMSGKAFQISTSEIDIAFKKICSIAERSPARGGFNTSTISQGLSLNSTNFQQKWF